MNTLEKIFEFSKKSEQLKQTKRWMDTPQMVNKETSADHSWHLALLAMVISKELDIDVDANRSIMLAIVHDLVEAIAGDTDHVLIATGIKTVKKKHDEEVKAINELQESLPAKSGEMIRSLWLEYEEAETREAKFIKALDKIEAINHIIVLGTKCYDRPDLIALYPIKAVKNFPELKPVLKELHGRLKQEFAKLKWDWKPEYEDY